MRDRAAERPAWAWIDLNALAHNARRAIALADGRSVIGVIKANAYGHGAPEIAKGLLAEGVSRLAVVSIAEGAELRREGIVAPILLMGGIDDRESAQRAVKLGLTPVVHNEEGLEILLSVGRASAPLAVEVEVDTGMRRMGVEEGQAARLIRRIQAAGQLVLAGVYTHLSHADARDIDPSRAQARAFAEILTTADLDPTGTRSAGEPRIHVVNSAGLFRRAQIEADELVTDAVRPGVMLYGVSPFAGDSDADSRAATVSDASPAAAVQDLRPVMTLAARVVALRPVSKGQTVGYGGVWRADRDTVVATLPLGYADGIPRSVVGRGAVYLGGALRPIVGRVSMDSICVDVGPDATRPTGSGRGIELGSVATIFGRASDGTAVPLESFAAAAGTIGYEILTGIGARVPRIPGSGPPPASDPRPLDSAV